MTLECDSPLPCVGTKRRTIDDCTRRPEWLEWRRSLALASGRMGHRFLRFMFGTAAFEFWSQMSFVGLVLSAVTLARQAKPSLWFRMHYETTTSAVAAIGSHQRPPTEKEGNLPVDVVKCITSLFSASISVSSNTGLRLWNQSVRWRERHIVKTEPQQTHTGPAQWPHNPPSAGLSVPPAHSVSAGARSGKKDEKTEALKKSASYLSNRQVVIRRVERRPQRRLAARIAPTGRLGAGHCRRSPGGEGRPPRSCRVGCRLR